MAKIKIVDKKVSDLIVYDNNPRQNDKAVSAVKESIKQFGITNPIIINSEDVILAGHTRLEALTESGITDVSCVQVKGLSEQEEKAFRIADNRTAEFAKWNQDLLEGEMKGVNADDWEKFGFKNKEIERLRPPENCTCPKCGKTFIKVK